ncbi:hypothetical protein [Lapidilactobacillus salsurivasis]
MRGSSSINDSLQNGVSAQTAVRTLSGWSGENRGEIAVKLTLAVYRLGQGSALRFAGFAKLKVTPTASSPRFSQRKLRATLKRAHRPSSLRLATQLFRKQSAASKTIARLMLRSYPGRFALWTQAIVAKMSGIILQNVAIFVKVKGSV